MAEEKKEKREIPELKPGYTVAVHQKIKEGDKERTQIFEGIIIAQKGGKTPGATFMVRKISEGIGVEKIFPLYSPLITKIKVLKKAKVKKAKLYYLRDSKKLRKLKEERVT